MNSRNDKNQLVTGDQNSRLDISSQPELMTQEEVIRFLRIPEISSAKEYGYVIENLKRMRGLPCIYISHKPLYPRKSILEWIDRQSKEKESK